MTHLCYSDFEDILPAIDGLEGAARPHCGHVHCLVTQLFCMQASADISARFGVCRRVICSSRQMCGCWHGHIVAISQGTHLSWVPAAADVLTIENSRSGDEMIAALASYGYSRDLGATMRQLMDEAHFERPA